MFLRNPDYSDPTFTRAALNFKRSIPVLPWLSAVGVRVSDMKPLQGKVLPLGRGSGTFVDRDGCYCLVYCCYPGQSMHLDELLGTLAFITLLEAIGHPDAPVEVYRGIGFPRAGPIDAVRITRGRGTSLHRPCVYIVRL